MITNFNINKENLSFRFEDRDTSVLDSIRRSLIRGLKLKILNVTKVTTNSDNIGHERVTRMFSLMYVNQLKCKNPNITFKFKYICHDDYIQIYSNNIKFYSKGKPIPTIIRKDIYLFTMIKGEEIDIIGNISLKKRSLIGNFGKKILSKTKWACTLNVIELWSPYRTFIAGVIITLDGIEEFKKIYKNKRKKTPLGDIYYFKDIDKGILNCICVEVNQELYETVTNCGVFDNHVMVTKETLRMHSDTPDKTLEQACDNIIEKLESILKQVNKQIKNKKEFNKVIDDY